MKGTIILLLCAVALAHSFELHDRARTCNCNPSEAEKICEANFGDDTVIISHENCDKFYQCSNGKPVALRCPDNLLYNPLIEQCDWPTNVDCGERPISEDSEEDAGSDEDTGDDDSGNVGTCNCDPSEAPAICAAEGSNEVLVAHENCNQYYMCAHGRPVTFSCGPNLLYNPYTKQCEWPYNVECGDRLIPEPDNDAGNDSDGENDANESDGTCNCKPEEAPIICAAPNATGVLVAHENCDQYYICENGRPIAQNCSGNLLFNPYTNSCDWPRNVECGDRIVPGCASCNGSSESDDPPCENDSTDDIDDVPPPGDDDGNDSTDIDDVPPPGDNDGNDSTDIDDVPPPGDDDGNDSTDIDDVPPPGDDDGNDSTDIDDVPPPGDDDGNDSTDIDDVPPPGDDDGNDSTDIDDVPPPGDDDGNDSSDIDAVPPPGDEDNNDSSDIDDSPPGDDDNGNESTEIDTVSPPGDDAGNNGTCNCNPEEAPSICTEENSNGILIAHQNCNQFYICDDGKPVTLDCPGNLLYNPYKEECDWPENIDCGDRVIPDPEDNNGNDSGDNDNDSDDNGNTDNDSGTNDNTGAGNCDPSEAPSICAAEDSDDILVAHENCNQYYVCAHGKPVALKCPGNLLFNPNIDQCDWPENVECGDRVIPDPEDDSGNDSGGSDNDVNDNGDTDNDSGSNDNTGAGNCDPSEAPSICAAEDSDNILVAHENCNQYYVCAYGKPVALKCPGNLLFNPNIDQCDWPANVDCGDRVIPDPDDDSGNDSGGSDNDSNNNEDTDNDSGSNDNTGAGNCDPSEAPSICAAEDSDNILVAHENCNQYYVCAYGKPVALKCPRNLLFNPNTDQCDWPKNVDCGDRIIPDPENNSNENDSEEIDIPPGDDDSGNDNDGNDPDDIPGNDSNGNDDGNDPDDSPGNDSNSNDDDNDADDNPGNYSNGNDPDDSPGNDSNGNDDGNYPDDSPDNDNGNDPDDSPGNDDDDGNNDNDSDCNNNENTESDQECNCKPEEAPSICADNDSDGTLIAHEYCNYFYQCVDYKPVAIKCAANLLYNPKIENCDWPFNVDCGERIIPDSVEDVSESEEIEDNDNDNDNVGTCNCNPQEAPSICAVGGSDGVMVAHENCNQYYQCVFGRPVAQTCASPLLYNPYRESCDWPANVECGDRVIPEPEEDNDNDSADDSTSADNNIVHDYPSQAPSICANSSAEGHFVSHENCTQYYVCTGGVPVAITCSGNLLFNPLIGQCDWPRNVDCGQRIIPGNNECACNFRNAPILCSRPDSNGKLIAHEMCNQFYMCVDNVPIARNCPANLYYNIDKETCDWPENVKCDNRMLPFASLNKHLESRQTLRT